MNISDIDEEVKNLFCIYGITYDQEVINGRSTLLINNHAAFPVIYSHMYTTTNNTDDIPIVLDDAEIGSLCLTSRLKSINSINNLTIHQIIAYTTYVDKGEFLLKSFPIPAYDYVVIHRNSIDEYIKYKNTSPLWGDYVHESGDLFSQKHLNIKSIIIDKEFKPRTKRHEKCLIMAAKSTCSIHKFLHLYHFLELDYDYHVVSSIKSLDEDDPKGLWEILDSKRDDIHRITALLSNYNNITSLEKLIYGIRNHTTTALNIFYNYGKASNPIKDKASFEEYFIKSSNIDFNIFKNIHSKNKKLQDLTNNENEYHNFLIRASAYWIYRTRCCIVHNKLGEYHIESNDDFEFINEFALPLLIELIKSRT